MHFCLGTHPVVILVPAQACNRFVQSVEQFLKTFFEELRRGPRLQTFSFHTLNVLLSLIDEADLIKRFITDGDKQINFRLITFTFLMLYRVRKINTALHSEEERGLMI